MTSSSAASGACTHTDIEDPITRLVLESSSVQLLGHSFRALTRVPVVSGSPFDRLLGTTRNASLMALELFQVGRGAVQRHNLL